MKYIHPTVLLLGIISLFNDMAGEMIYPLLPLFLFKTLGTGAFRLGLIEGIAEATASLLKVISGIWTDRSGKRKPFILVGYGMAGLAKPLIGLAGSWPAVLALRFMDRVGKGIRTSPRDALIADVSPPEHRGASFGFHRAMDHAGAVIGPLVAALLLMLPTISLREVFFLAAIPAAISFLIAWIGIKESSRTPVAAPTPLSKPIKLSSWNRLSSNYKLYLFSIFIFTLGNSTDAFILLRLSDAGASATWVAVLWSLHHIIKMAANYYGGRLSDRWGHRRQLGLGWIFYAVVYLLFAITDSISGIIAVFMLYGLYYGLVEPSERALAVALAPDHLRGTALGYFHLTLGLAALPASLLFGMIWQNWGHGPAFFVGAALALIATLALQFNDTKSELKNGREA
ncbi:MAG: MFS transporter [Candidatus Nitrohelix vancouverensis]|uniref:MFS transporter n=1 Tax=Candidatus Nitrohelix vancouverensis TaxID=2705534 RepID=A0A7T0C3T2_9BACT|nr:MAG: MFS transporter [Candidatus Nitrohelix vancouverensis]